MSLGPGTRLGPYEIVSALGAGGMGEVYRARDTRLKRDVALKILSESFASDPDRLARFQREAEVLASLNHPNIAAIHGLEESDSTRALVMELVEGEDLSQRIARGVIPLDEALPIAKQIWSNCARRRRSGGVDGHLVVAYSRWNSRDMLRSTSSTSARIARSGWSFGMRRSGDTSLNIEWGSRWFPRMAGIVVRRRLCRSRFTIIYDDRGLEPAH